MKAKIRDIGFAPDIIIAGIDFYYEEGELGYENSWVNVPDYPATELEPKPSTHLELAPFRSISLTLSPNVTRDEVIKLVRRKLESFRNAHTKAEQAQQFVGLEIVEEL